jgi:uncharacterized membrane protein HdeD (DUF308 family)
LENLQLVARERRANGAAGRQAGSAQAETYKLAYRRHPLWDDARMTTPTAPTLLPHLWKSVLVSGILAVALGIAIVAWPGISISIATIFFGVALLFTGIEQIIFGFTMRAPFAGRLLLFVTGAATLIVGVMALSSIYDGWQILAIWIGIGFIFRGVSTTLSAISDPTLPGRVFNIAVGLLSLVAGIIVMAVPYNSLKTLALFVGFSLIVVGVMEVVASLGMRKARATFGNAIGAELGTKDP